MKTRVVIRQVLLEEWQRLPRELRRCIRPDCDEASTHVIQSDHWTHYVCDEHAQEFKEKHPDQVKSPESDVNA